MRFLHTSDWHVGKTLRGKSRADEHRAALAEIAGIAAERQADVVLVAGDLFDSAAPSAESEQIVYEALLAFVRTGAHVVCVAGNHDNPQRLRAVKPLLDLSRVHARPVLLRPEEGGVLNLEARSGGKARVACFPFLSQRGIVKASELMSQIGSEHSQSYADRAEKILTALCKDLPEDSVNVLLAHAMVTGGVLGGGERSAHTIFEYCVPAAAFAADRLHYVALGHLHRAQEIAAGLPVRYCGSPLQLDFGETGDEKSVTWIEAEPGRPARIEEITLAAGRKLRRVRGTLDAVLAGADSYGDAYLLVELLEPARAGLSDEVYKELQGAVDVRIVSSGAAPAARGERKLGRDPDALFAEYLASKEIQDPEVLKLFHALLEEAHAEAREDAPCAP